LGVEKALNYKSSTFKKDLRSLGYIDAYFDNVGGWDNTALPVVALLLTSFSGEILDLVLTRLQKNARIALCGAISAYS
jgi:NADPH-dependent curcumin reductase CurA